MTETEWSRKKRSSLHLDPEVNDRIDDVLRVLKRDMKVRVKKNTLMEKWVADGLEFMEEELKINKN